MDIIHCLTEEDVLIETVGAPKTETPVRCFSNEGLQDPERILQKLYSATKIGSSSIYPNSIFWIVFAGARRPVLRKGRPPRQDLFSPQAGQMRHRHRRRTLPRTERCDPSHRPGALLYLRCPKYYRHPLRLSRFHPGPYDHSVIDLNPGAGLLHSRAGGNDSLFFPGANTRSRKSWIPCSSLTSTSCLPSAATAPCGEPIWRSLGKSNEGAWSLRSSASPRPSTTISPWWKSLSVLPRPWKMRGQGPCVAPISNPWGRPRGSGSSNSWGATPVLSPPVPPWPPGKSISY